MKLLKDLEVGERFYPASKADKNTPIFEVVDKHQGMSKKVLCKNLLTNKNVMKLAKQEVIVYRRS